MVYNISSATEFLRLPLTATEKHLRLDTSDSTRHTTTASRLQATLERRAI